MQRRVVLRAALVAIVLLLGSIVGYAWTRWRSAEAHLRAAVSEMTSGHYRAAELDLKKARSDWPWLDLRSLRQRLTAAESSHAHYEKAQQLLAIGNLDGAFRELSRVAEGTPDAGRARAQLRRLQSARKQIDRVTAVLRDGQSVDDAVEALQRDEAPIADSLNRLMADFFTDGAAYLQAAQDKAVDLDADVSTLQQAVSAFSTDFGMFEQRGWVPSSVGSLAGEYQTVATQANTLANALHDAMHAAQTLPFYMFQARWSEDTAAANQALQTIAQQVSSADQALQLLRGYTVAQLTPVVGSAVAESLQPAPVRSSPAAGAVTAAFENEASPAQLVSFQSDGLQLLVPARWSRSRIEGVDWHGWKFINPDDPNQQLVVVESACAGCYTDWTTGQVTPQSLLSAVPESEVTGSFVFNHGRSVGYDFRPAGNPYVGHGVITTPGPGQGYAYAEVIVPDGKKDVATRILNSFSFDGMGG